MISSSAVNVPGVGELAILIAYVPLSVAAEAAVPLALFGSLIKVIFLKSFTACYAFAELPPTPKKKILPLFFLIFIKE